MNEADRQQLDRLLDDDLSPEERNAVRGLLEADPEAVAYLADRAILVSDLRRSLKRRQLQRDAGAHPLGSMSSPKVSSLRPSSPRNLAKSWVSRKSR